ncbi:hypothetical protein K0504_08985 [Neiella marina]|uniref:Uncharacterized protein n=1 Tax=Neiella holothuriorum TaxID=2870530 RepID=A0ABS7EGX7_9GAMM|nr:hypothetical protein [Neiella holothuriorum]MBW8191168.1 hypothetical protein [Neiella holothuriorum]
MFKRIFWLTVILLSVIHCRVAIAAPGINSAVEHSMLMIDEVQLERWAFDRILRADDQTRIAHHEPRQQHFNGWSLRSVNGKPSSIDEQWQFLQDFAPAQPESKNKPLVENRLTRMVQPDSLALLSKTEVSARYSFSPRLNSIDQTSLADLVGLLWFDVKHQHITKVEIKSTAPLNSTSGVIFSDFNLTLTFVREQGFVLPQRVEMRFEGQVDGLNVFAQDTQQSYQNYQLIFPPPTFAERLISDKQANM